ncbi:tRNA (adenosine(37)-N6)-dimethylallyltransferase MiaA [Polynucleobacter sp. IMCC30063]|uniref:tRNA (adenosine(37)-N6)-dimethylallyltransferase MiaA n=1 Tax=unclassified Polynucleobacter TaxID=2640945 RepID=UPI001F0077D0|nr:MULTISPECIES: tRNA (adenosine(37)-N6)-dimethylallyltransferase MiaA [unclassified Polynucleobacter]MCE7506647.1 tRNA (adenosine(37)-N6)-dimethylallyltransferase MiaA [Polynucleobacter sp. IMCC30063]MCE7526663.1 tRNA (adenosine(37)-N6)-dimethylallyltransferase MiaA [Polynucleobacter sp. IMCC 30228]
MIIKTPERLSEVLCIVGPTGSGKSHLAMTVAQQAAQRGVKIELISMDSALVYRGLDIGSAKPSSAERALVPHHLIDILEPYETYSAARFAADTKRLCAEIQLRGHIPLVVGGTMLYWRAWAYGLSVLPEASPRIRQELETRAARLGWPALHAELNQIDPLTAARLKPHDAQRIQRALEVFLVSGRPLSTWLAENPSQDGRTGATIPAGLKLVALEPSERKKLHEDLATRFDAMLQQGLIAEVAALRQRPEIHADLPAMRAVGYRQVWHYLAGHDSLEGMREKALAASRQLAKRQLTWLRAISARQCFDSLTTSGQQQALNYCLEQLKIK